MPPQSRGQSSGEHRVGRLGRFRLHRNAERPAAAESKHITTYVVEGKRQLVPKDTPLTEVLEFSEGGPDRMTLTMYSTPSPKDIEELTRAWDLHPMLAEDLRNAGQRPKLERYDDVLFIVARSARYLDAAEDVDFSEFHVIIKGNAMAVLCQDGRWVDDNGLNGSDSLQGSTDTVVRGTTSLLSKEHLLQLGPEAVLYRLLDEIVDGFSPVIRGILVDKEQIERQVFDGDSTVAERIYRLNQEVIDLQHATTSLASVLDELNGGYTKYGIPEDLQEYLGDVSDNLTRIVTNVVELRASLTQILQVNSTLVAQRQNEDMKKISGWAAILFAPTLVGAIYGMNFDTMPELHWTFGYPAALTLMLVLSVGLWLIFKHNKWM